MTHYHPYPAGGEPAGRRTPAAAPPPVSAPAWAGRAVLALGLLAGVVLAGHPLGAGVVLLLFALGGVAAGGVAHGRRTEAPAVDLRAAGPAAGPARPDLWRALWWALAGALACLPFLRAAGWVVWPAILTSAALASLAVTGGALPRELRAALAAVVRRMPRGLALAGRVAAEGVSLRGAGPAARGAALAAAVLAVFVPLLVSADAAFAEIVQSALPAGWSVDRPVARALAALSAAAGGGALLHAGLRPPVAARKEPRVRLGRLDVALPLGALVALLGGFVAFQLTTLFGGNRHVLATAGLTYAQYARSGFVQLLVVAALVLAVVAAANRWAARPPRGLLVALCLLTLVVLASAVHRLHLYEEAYGFTRLRLTADAIVLWLGALFVLVLTARGGAAWLPRACVAASAAAVLLFGLSDPERRIAERNVQSGRIDADYLATLGPDAAPVLVRLGIAPRLPASDGLVGLNLARERARRLLRGQTP